MYEIDLPVTFAFRMDDRYVALCIHFIHNNYQPVLLVKLEPLYH